ncbi:MAG: Glycosyl hydrolase family 57 [Methanosaeta sp. PtaB.Bin039]|nr:MAG: Glycosyl hydrolase family 57 [Methanosaeta sp. PtaB.Bin039]
MTHLSLCFEVHQPLRLRRDFFWSGDPMRGADSLDQFYLDEPENRRIFERVATKCYRPANQVVLESIRRFVEADRPFKVAYSLSGIFLEQCQRTAPDVVKSFQDLVETGFVELLEQTYYHSLCSLYPEGDEFREQVRMHRELIWDLFAVRPTVFENTELLYDDRIASLVEGMGYRGIFAEGVLANPNYVYQPLGRDISLLLRNFQLTDDVGFRFSSRDWKEHPLTADKYASWLGGTPGQVINLFMDYETFGEHQWEDTGIFEFLRHLPAEVMKKPNLRFALPAELAALPRSGVLAVSHTRSWADLERDTSCWLGNELQQACYLYHWRLQRPAAEAGAQMQRIWRTLGLSDHLYYMFTRGGGPGMVHSYFSPYGNPYDASITYFSVLSDLHHRLKVELPMADHPFRLAGGMEVWSAAGMAQALAKIDLDALEDYMEKQDLARWAGTSLHQPGIEAELNGLSIRKGERLRQSVIRIFRGFGKPAKAARKREKRVRLK